MDERYQGQGFLVRLHRKRSSPGADVVALLCAATLLVLTFWLRGAALISSGRSVYLVVAITTGFAGAARLLRGVSTSGAVSGAAVAFALASRDLGMFWILLIVFCITLAATRAGASRKRLLKVSEGEHGRSASQVMANLGVATLAVASPAFAPGYLLAMAALAELAADTISSEIGAAFSGKTILITSGKSVPPGTDGGISLVGTLAGAIAALFTTACAVLFGFMSPGTAALAAGAAILGMMVDSLVGATLERRGYLNNDLVNLLSTGSAAAAAWALAH